MLAPPISKCRESTAISRGEDADLRQDLLARPEGPGWTARRVPVRVVSHKRIGGAGGLKCRGVKIRTLMRAGGRETLCLEPGLARVLTKSGTRAWYLAMAAWPHVSFQATRRPFCLPTCVRRMAPAKGQRGLPKSFVCHERPSSGNHARWLGPTYSSSGRISRPSNRCSRMCAVHPATRATANVGVNSSLGRPAHSSSIAV